MGPDKVWAAEAGSWKRRKGPGISLPLSVSPADSPVALVLSALAPCFVQPHTDVDCCLCADSIGVQLLPEKSLASWL